MTKILGEVLEAAGVDAPISMKDRAVNNEVSETSQDFRSGEYLRREPENGWERKIP